MNYIISEELKKNLQVVLTKATHPTASWEVVYSLIDQLNKLPIYEESKIETPEESE